MAQLRTVAPQSLKTIEDVQRAYEKLVSAFNNLAGAEFSGSGSPEGVITAPVGCRYRRLDGGAGTALYVKESGTGNTGWTPK